MRPYLPSIITVLAVLFCALALLLLPEFGVGDSAEHSAEEWNTKIPRMVAGFKAGTVTADELADELTSLGEYSSEVQQTLNGVVIDDEGFKEILARRLLSRIEEIVTSQSSASAGGLRKVGQIILGDNSKWYAQILKLLNIVDQAEHFTAIGNIDRLVTLRDEVKGSAERRIIEIKIARFFHHSAEENIDTGHPERALRQLVEISPAWRTKGTYELAGRAIVAIEKLTQTTPQYLDAYWPFSEQPVQEMVLQVENIDPGVSIALADIYSWKVLRLVSTGKGAEAGPYFEAVLRLRPDPNPENKKLRLETAIRAIDPPGKAFAAQRIDELNSTGALKLGDRAKLLFAGYYGSVLLYLLVAGLVLFFVCCIVLLVTRSGISEMLLEAREKRNERNYQDVLEKGDEYSELLALFGLGDNASESQIKKAYRKAMKDYHPDQRTGASAAEDEATKKFMELQKAYERITEIRSSWFGR